MKTLLFALACFVALLSSFAQAHNGEDHSGQKMAQAIEWVPAEVVKVDVARRRIILNHGPMHQPVMESMVMPFHVAQPDLLRGIEVGQKVRFQLNLNDGELVLTHLERIQ